MMQELEKAKEYLNILCSVKPNRRTGSPGNRAATDFFAATVKKWGYTVDTTPFPCLDYESGNVSLICRDEPYTIYVSPFSPACDVTAELVTVSTVTELEHCRCGGNILLMRGDLCAEQLMPKNFVFYNPEHHKKIYALLEEKKPAAIVAATEKKPELVGALYPFPLIEDGDFDMPSVYCTDVTGEKILAKTGEVFRLVIEARRIPATACNVIAVKNQAAPRKIVLSAHIDAYWSTPGAVDNAAGVTVLLLLAEMLNDFKGEPGIEILAFNGEDYYGASGQMDYLRRYGQDFSRIAVAINIDDAGYKNGKTAYSLYECPDEISRLARNVFTKYNGIMEGEQWYQSDHMIFVQRGRPAIAVASENIAELMSTIAHTPKDTPDMVDCEKLVETAYALHDLVKSFENQ
ncbi:MAG: M28 family peptidase [Candidatus Omnitrophica bacterium]|nr:M28 family peptidase [Candidatus Omnitrophota bacterium]